ncbi:MAG: beta-galactosidase GalA [Candidatus Acidiferrales bacterium]
MQSVPYSARFLTTALLLVFAVPAGAQNAAHTEAGSVAPSSHASGRERLLLDRGWLFHEGDIPFPVITGHEPSYANAKAGSSSGAASPEFDDSSWKQVDLPHDWAVEQPFDPNANSAQGYRDRGMGWYRKYFRLDPADHGKHLELQFDGIATHSTIWVNGVLSVRNWSGYNSVYVDITPIARFGPEVNTIAVQVDAVAQEGWWYEGAGIYRHVWLVKRNPVHIETDGIYANPVRNADGAWSIPVEATLYSMEEAPANVEVEATLIDPSGKEVVSGKIAVTVAPLQEPVAKLALAVASPRLWSVDEPTLYSLRTEVKRDGKVVDEVITRIGFRTIRFDSNKGFFLNDQSVKLLGTCNHQDFAGVGVAVPDAIWDFRIKRLKEMGSNAYRCAHNAPAAEFLDACDRLGMLVMDENRNFGSSPEHLRQLDWMVRRDRNNPSVVLWSVFNEEPSQGTEMGYEMVRRMSATVKDRDTTRPVTAAQSNSLLNPVNASQAADVAGFNYVYRDYDEYHARYPRKPIFSSEDTSTVMTRDEYVTNRAEGVLDSYDDQVMPWGLSHRDAWKQIAERRFVAGTMVWSGFDYRGETEPLTWPSAGSSYGAMDLCGFAKAAYYIHQAQWIQNRPILHFVPHWNWAGSEGKPIKVMVTTNAERVALILNGKPLGAKSVDKYEMVTFDVPYEAGKLEAVASSDGKEVARFAVETTGAPAGLRLIPERTGLVGDGYNAQPVTVQVVDAQGRVVPTANSLVKLALSGPGTIIGLNNGDPRNHEPEKGNEHTVFHGLAQVILQSSSGGQGKLTLRASSEGLTPSELVIDVTPTEPRPAVPVIPNPPLVILNWKRSPITTTRPAPNEIIGNAEINKWSEAYPGSWLVPFHDGLCAIYRAQFTPRAVVQRLGGQVVLRQVAGKAQVWIDGKLLGEKTNAEKKDMTVSCSGGAGERSISVLIEAAAVDAPAGLGGTVTVE